MSDSDVLNQWTVVCHWNFWFLHYMSTFTKSEIRKMINSNEIQIHKFKKVLSKQQPTFYNCDDASDEMNLDICDGL